jgi:hypothetical protein
MNMHAWLVPGMLAMPHMARAGLGRIRSAGPERFLAVGWCHRKYLSPAHSPRRLGIYVRASSRAERCART